MWTEEEGAKGSRSTQEDGLVSWEVAREVSGQKAGRRGLGRQDGACSPGEGRGVRCEEWRQFRMISGA